MPDQERVRRPRVPAPPGPLAGDPIWYEDPVRKGRHSQLVRAGMERAREHGKRIGRPKVSERDGFAERLAAVVAQMGPDGIPRRQAAKELAIGYATLKRLLDAQASPLGRDSSRAVDSMDTGFLSTLPTPQWITSVED